MMDRPRRGQRLRAKTLNDIVDANRSNEIIVSDNLVLSKTALGTSVETDGGAANDSFWIQLQSAGVGIAAGKYSWKYAKRNTGSWTIGAVGGTLSVNWAYEANGFATLGVVFVETIIVPIYILCSNIECPVSRKR